MTHLINLIAQRHNTLEDENLLLQEQLKAAKNALSRMDRKREGLFRFVNHLRLAWTPSNPSNGDAQGIKEDVEKFHAALAEAIAAVNRDSAYCTSKDAALERAISEEAAKAFKRHKEIEQKLIADKWARKARTSPSGGGSA